MDEPSRGGRSVNRHCPGGIAVSDSDLVSGWTNETAETRTGRLRIPELVRDTWSAPFPTVWAASGGPIRSHNTFDEQSNELVSRYQSNGGAPDGIACHTGQPK